MRPLSTIAICMSLASSSCELADRDVPAPYRGLDVPEETLASPEARAEGRALFLRHCALCHGEAADGRGERRAAMSPPATDFTSRRWRERADPRATFAAIREGVRGTPMPAWRQLSDEEVWRLVAYLLAVSEEGS